MVWNLGLGDRTLMVAKEQRLGIQEREEKIRGEARGKENGSKEAQERKGKKTCPDIRGNGGEKGEKDPDEQKSKNASSAVMRILWESS
jgi:hypothetical protein